MKGVASMRPTLARLGCGSSARSHLGDKLGVGRCRLETTVLPQVGQYVEVLAPRARFETNARGRVAVEQEDGVAQHAVDEIGRRVVEHDELHGQIEAALQLR